MAISTAKENARINKVADVDFQLGDARRWKSPRSPKDESVRSATGRIRPIGELADKIDIVTANLFSELLIEVLPRLQHARWLILSGVLREQEKELFRALKRNKIGIVEVRRRGKWIAAMARVG
jgi:ribosomal protein L11 methylase PrmA